MLVMPSFWSPLKVTQKFHTKKPYTGTPPLTWFFGPGKNRVKGKPRYRRSILVLKPQNREFESSKSTFLWIFDILKSTFWANVHYISISIWNGKCPVKVRTETILCFSNQITLLILTVMCILHSFIHDDSGLSAKSIMYIFFLDSAFQIYMSDIWQWLALLLRQNTMLIAP